MTLEVDLKWQRPTAVLRLCDILKFQTVSTFRINKLTQPLSLKLNNFANKINEILVSYMGARKHRQEGALSLALPHPLEM